MILSWIFTYIFLFIIFLEIYFLGSWLSIKYDFFHNRTLATFTIGFLFYFVLSFIAIFPFIWFSLELMYYAIILLLKDFFTIVFLVVQREKFNKFKTNKLHFLTLILMMVILPLYYRFVLNNINPLHPLVQDSEYQIWLIFASSISNLSRGTIEQVNISVVHPLAASIMYASIASLFFEFSKKDKYLNAFLSIVMTLLIVTLFNGNIALESTVFIGLYAFLFLTSYYIIVHSRRRFGILFGLTFFTIWIFNNDTFWSLILISILIFTIYLILKKPRPSVFFFQFVSPMLLVTSLMLAEISQTLSIILSILAVIIYISIIFIVRIKWVEKVNKTFIFKYFRYLFLGTLILVVTILNIIILVQQGINFEIFYTNNELTFDFNNHKINLFLNLEYYIIVLVASLYTIYNILNKVQFTQLKLVSLISLLGFLLIFNPFIASIFNNWNSISSYQYLKLFVVMPLIVVFLAQINILKINPFRAVNPLIKIKL